MANPPNEWGMRWAEAFQNAQIRSLFSSLKCDVLSDSLSWKHLSTLIFKSGTQSNWKDYQTMLSLNLICWFENQAQLKFPRKKATLKTNANHRSHSCEIWSTLSSFRQRSEMLHSLLMNRCWDLIVMHNHELAMLRRSISYSKGSGHLYSGHIIFILFRDSYFFNSFRDAYGHTCAWKVRFRWPPFFSEWSVSYGFLPLSTDVSKLNE